MWFFFVHRYCHINKWLFAHVHAMHHRSDAYLNVTSNSFEHPVDGFFAVVIPTGLIAWLGLWTGNFWAMFFPLHLVACVFVFGAPPLCLLPLPPPPLLPLLPRGKGAAREREGGCW